MMIRISVDDPRWSALVASHSEAGPFHHPAWAALLAATYGFDAFALVDFDEHGLVNRGLPVLEIGGRLQRRAWVALPYTDYLPVLTSSPAENHTFLAAVDRAWRDADVGYLEVRSPVPGYEAYQFETDVIHRLELNDDPHVVFQRFHQMAARGVRKAEREGLTVRRGERPEDLTEVFRSLHLITRRRQGAPIQPRRFFQLLWDEFLARQLGYVLLAYHGREPVAGAVFLVWNGILTYKFGASNPAALNLRPNHLIFWRAIRDACSQGMRMVDMGLSDHNNAGLRAFKSRWGATEEPLLFTTLTEGPRGHRAGHAPRLLQAVIRHSPPIVCKAAGELLYRYAA